MELVTYKKYNDQQQAESLAELLQENGIAYEITEDRDNLASFYGDNQFRRDFYVKIKNEDFEKADSILLAISTQELETVDKDHYLYGFADEELLDILRKPDEWNELPADYSAVALFASAAAGGDSGALAAAGFLARLSLGRGVSSTFMSRSPSILGGESA